MSRLLRFLFDNHFRVADLIPFFISLKALLLKRSRNESFFGEMVSLVLIFLFARCFVLFIHSFFFLHPRPHILFFLIVLSSSNTMEEMQMMDEVLRK
jgi:hypothetical protein